jgi:23S rRNA (cytosine1962-C5)-methyltransferase
VEVVGPGPDVEEYERPEVNDRQAVRVYRPLHALRDEVVHDAEEAGGEEETDGVVAVPPLRHGILNAREQDVALRAEHGHRQGQIVDDVQHRDGDDEGEVEPVRDVDVRLFAFPDRAEVDQQVRDPDDCQEKIGVPLGLRILLALRDAEQVAGAGHDDEDVVAPHDEPRRPAAGEARVARALHHVERGREQHVAAEGEDHRRRVQRAKPAEARPGHIEVQRRKGQLPSDHDADEKAGDAPEYRGERGELDRSVEPGRGVRGRLGVRHDPADCDDAADGQHDAVEGDCRVVPGKSPDHADQREEPGSSDGQCVRQSFPLLAVSSHRRRRHV